MANYLGNWIAAEDDFKYPSLAVGIANEHASQWNDPDVTNALESHNYQAIEGILLQHAWAVPLYWYW